MKTAPLRRRLGLTQAKLAELTGVHAMTVSKWERGVLAPNAHQRAILRSLEAASGRRGPAPRRESEHARELAGLLTQAHIDFSEVGDMKLSASNQFRGKVVEIDEGPVTSRLVIEIAPRVRIVSLITTASVKRLGLGVGKPAVAIIKATEVIVGVP
jgi:molybdopterin-binding protein